MKIKEPTMQRQGKVITNLVANTSDTYKSISLAKKASKEWQKANGGLGSGALRVKR